MNPGAGVWRSIEFGGLCFAGGVIALAAGLAFASGVGKVVVGLLLELLWKAVNCGH